MRLESRDTPGAMLRAYWDSPAAGLDVTLGEWQWPPQEQALGYGTDTPPTVWLNPRVNWWDDVLPPPPDRYDLYTVALHEYGHAAGLDHTRTGFMRPFTVAGTRIDNVTVDASPVSDWWGGGIDVSRGRGVTVAGALAGGGPHVRVWASGREVASFFAFAPGFTGGVSVGGWDDVVAVGAGPGGGPHVRVWQGGVETASFLAFDPGFLGGVEVTVGPGWVAVGAGGGGGPNVRYFDTSGTLLSSIFVGDPGSTAGASLVRGDHGWFYQW